MKKSCSKKHLLLILAVLLECTFAFSCSKGGVTTGDYVAKVGDVKFTKEDVRAALHALPVMGRQVFQGPEGTARFVAELARRESLYQEAKKRGLDQDKEAQRRLEEAQKNALVGYLLQKEVEDVARFDDKDMKKYYDSHPDEFTRREQVRVSQVVVKDQEEAKKVLARLIAGEDFAKVAAAVSLDKATAKSKGDLGFLTRTSKVAPTLVQEAFGTKKGEVGRPVTLPDGVYLVKVTDIKGTVAGFEEVKGFIFQQMAGERRKAAMDKLLESAKKNYPTEINKDAVAKLPPLVPVEKGSPQLPPGHPAMPNR
jgi:parvulin-like peptidyl-prolyl isomerase